MKDRLLKVSVGGVYAAGFSMLVYTLHMIIVSVLKQDSDSGMLYWIVLDALYLTFLPLILSYLMFGFYAKIRRNILGDSEETENNKERETNTTTVEATDDILPSRSSYPTSSSVDI